jgi:beta-glucosidase/6-phospho-beta-glucosidase/beta-galactosidase
LENSFLNASYPDRVAEYATAVAERYQTLVKYYTPLNEPMVNAEFCGRRGEWPPYLQGDDGDVKLTMALGRGLVETTRALRSAQPDAQMVQVEALWHYWTNDLAIQEQVERNNARQYLAFDLVTGRVGENYPLIGWLRQHGAQENELGWFRNHAVQFDVFGANFYPWSYGEVRKGADGQVQRLPRRTSGSAIAGIIHQVWERYQMPVMITETSSPGSLTRRATWMDETITSVRALRQSGIPVVGYTWFPLFTMIDWAYRRGRRPIEKYLLHLGLYDSQYNPEGILERHPTRLVEHYQQHQSQPFADIS